MATARKPQKAKAETARNEAPVTTNEQGPLVKNELKQVWVEPRPPAPAPAVAVAPAPAVAVAPAPEDEDLDFFDPIEQFLCDLDTAQGYTLRVDRLTHFSRDGRTGLRAPKEFCKSLQFDLNTYLQTIADTCGPGAYWLTLRYSNGQVAKYWTEHVAELPATAAAAAAAAPVIAPAPAHRTAIDELDELERFAKKLASIKTSMGWAAPTELQATAPAPPSPVVPLEERIFSRLFDHAIDSGDDTKIERLLSSYLGKGESKETSSWIMDLLERVAAPFIPALLQQMTANGPAPAPGQVRSTHRPAPAAAPPTSRQAPAKPGAAAPPAAARPAAPAPVIDIRAQVQPDQIEPEEEFSEEYMSLDEMLDNLVQDLVAQSKEETINDLYSERGAGWVTEFRAQFPALSMFIDGLINGAPASVLSSLETFNPDYVGVSRLPLATEYITALQERTKGKLKGI